MITLDFNLQACLEHIQESIASSIELSPVYQFLEVHDNRSCLLILVDLFKDGCKCDHHVTKHCNKVFLVFFDLLIRQDELRVEALDGALVQQMSHILLILVKSGHATDKLSLVSIYVILVDLLPNAKP